MGHGKYLQQLKVLMLALLIANEVYGSPIDTMKNDIEEMKRTIHDLQMEHRNIKERLAVSDTLVTQISDPDGLKPSPRTNLMISRDVDTGASGKLLTRSKRRAICRRKRCRIVRRPARPSAPEVGFQVILLPRARTFHANEPIKFDRTITNIGNAYNSDTGIFTAPASGTYLFNLNIVSHKDSYVEASIQHNKQPTVTAVSDHRKTSGVSRAAWDQGSTVAILKLRKDDNVSAAVQWPKGSHTIHGAGKSSFSGYLLRTHKH